MASTNIVESAGGRQKLLTANDATAAFVARVPTATKPTLFPDGNAIPLIGGGEGGGVASTLKLIFFGAGADNSTFSVRVIGWSKTGATWVPEPICQADIILGGILAPANADFVATDRFADTITPVAGAGIGVVRALALADACPAVLEVGTGGCALITVEFDMTGATSGNCLWGTY